jgi:uncharacterized membrane protein
MAKTAVLAGKVVVDIQQQPNGQAGSDSWIPNQFANTIFSDSEAELQKLVNAGMDERFLEMVITALAPGYSMILIFVCQDSMVDTLQVLEAIRQYNGTLYHTTISPLLEEVFMK